VPLPSGTVITFLRHARAVANEGIEAAFREILARHGPVEAPVAAISNTDKDKAGRNRSDLERFRTDVACCPPTARGRHILLFS
jgi:hypothetical protein